jgi:hypothetical protein
VLQLLAAMPFKAAVARAAICAPFCSMTAAAAMVNLLLLMLAIAANTAVAAVVALLSTCTTVACQCYSNKNVRGCMHIHSA